VRCNRKVTKPLLYDFRRHLLTVLGHNFDKTLIDHTLSTSSRWHALSRKTCSCLADVNLLIFQTESRHFVRLRNDITNQFHEIIVTIVGEEILGLNDHQPGDEGKECHFCVFMKRLF
jgi:hypothetical protein